MSDTERHNTIVKTEVNDVQSEGAKVITETSDVQRSTFSKVIETGFLILTWLALSTYVEIYGPTLIDLKNRLQTDYEHVAVAVSGRSVGWFPGSIVAGFLSDRFSGYCHVIIAISLDVAAGVTAAIPWSPNVTYTWFFCFVGGFAESHINIAGTRILFKIWREKSFSPLMMIHLGYGIGSFIVPLYCNPFLADTWEQSSDNNRTTEGNVTTQSAMILTSTLSNQDSSESLQDDNSRIEYAYTISAAVVASVSVVFYGYQIKEIRSMNGKGSNTESKTENTQEKTRSFKEMINPATCAGGRFCYGSQILFLLFLYFGNIGGGDRMVAGFMRSYSIDQLGFSKDSASFLITSFWITFSVGRFIFALVSRCVSARILIIVETGGMAISSILLMIFAVDNSLSLWIVIQCFSFFCSASWPTGIAWTDYHIELTGLGMSLQIFGASVGGVCHMRLIGYIYEHYGPKAFLYQIMGYGILQFVLAILLDIVGAQHGSRFESADGKNVDVKTSTVVEEVG